MMTGTVGCALTRVEALVAAAGFPDMVLTTYKLNVTGVTRGVVDLSLDHMTAFWHVLRFNARTRLFASFYEMVVKKISPNRRRSIAVPNQNRPSIVPKARRRAHSIVPGAALSPLAKARRSLVRT